MTTIDLEQLRHKLPEIILGTLGSVGHGKSVITRQLTGTVTGKFKAERKHNCTIRLGYANGKLYHCKDCKKYTVKPAKTMKYTCEECSISTDLALHYSFVDCPGHEAYMSTMLSGTSSMDSAIFVVAANESFPAPQTVEHFVAANVREIPKFLTVLNKIDLATRDKLEDLYTAYREFANNTPAELAPVVPVSAELGVNIDALCDHICRLRPPARNLTSPAHLAVIRSFNVNKAGMEDIHKLAGGVVGGTLRSGVLRIGDPLEIRPGLIKREDGHTTCEPLFTKVVSLRSDISALDVAIPGGLIAIGTTLDPTLTLGDRMVGQIIGVPGTLPEVHKTLNLRFNILRHVQKQLGKEVGKFRKDEVIQLNINSAKTRAKIGKISKHHLYVHLEHPVCLEDHAKVSISRRFDNGWRLVGVGSIGEQIGKIMEETDETEEVWEDLEDFSSLLDRAGHVIKSDAKHVERIHLHPPKVGRRGRCTIVANWAQLCADIKRENQQILNFFEAELLTNCTVLGDGALCVRGRFNSSHIQKIIKNFFREFVTCIACKSHDTNLVKDGRLRVIKCINCGSSRTI